MKKHLGIVAALWLLTSAFVHADTSYLLIQGPFGAGSAEETFKWRVNAPAGFLATGKDLLTAVFGIFKSDGTYTNAYNNTFSAFKAGDGTQGARIYFDPAYNSFALVSFTLASTTVLNNDAPPAGTSTQDWGYYVDGGGGVYGGDLSGGPYPDNGSWTLANEGFSDRHPANGSFDGWVFGSSGYGSDGTPYNDGVTITGSGNAPVPANFTGATVISVPEPSPAVFFLGGTVLLVFYRTFRRR